MPTMTDEAPVPTSIQARIAALKLEKVPVDPQARPPPSYEQAVAGARKKPPPPPLPKRPAGSLNRAETTNNPPLSSNGIASTQTVGNLPAKGEVLPAPMFKKWEKSGPTVVSTPSLPPRRPSQPEGRPVPSLPPRRPSESSSLTRRPSVESVSSITSGRSSISGISTPRTSFSIGSGNPYPKNRVRAPEYDPATLPALPERKAKQEDEREKARLPLRPTMSVPNGLPLSRRSSRDPPPSLPNRPALPSRTGTIAEPPPPSLPRRSALEFGMNKAIEIPPPLPTNRPSPGIPSANSPALVELDSSNFDEIVLRSGKPAFVDFYAPFCKFCKDIDPIYLELAESYQYADVTIAKIDSYTNKEIGERYNIQGWPTFKFFDGRGGAPIDYDSGHDMKWFTKWITEKMGIKPGSRSSLPTPSPSNGSTPPPVPMSSRPNLAALQNSKPKSTTASAQAGVCMKCRDFSGPDNHAARFPRQSVPSTDITWLAHQLCDPFPSATDKARAIFTWLHHNIDYNTVAFFNNNVKSSTPNSTLSTGLAVCEGYAALFTALAMPAGLESVVVSGHGKGFGSKTIKPDDPIPPQEFNHAWNAVKIDNGEWKLIDSCWGAGDVKGANMPYNKNFKPEHFTKSNDDFGISHFPKDSRYFFRDDGRRFITWEEYMLLDASAEEKCTVYTPAKGEHGLDPDSFLPKAMSVRIRDPNGTPTVRFQFNKICQHYNLVGKHGQPYLFFIKLKRPGRDEEFKIFQTDGYYWWCDIQRAELGRPGDELMVSYAMHYNSEKTSGRGLSEQAFLKGVRMGRPGGWHGWQWSHLAKYTVA